MCLKTPNPEGFWITPKTLRDIWHFLKSIFPEKMDLGFKGSDPLKV